MGILSILGIGKKSVDNDPYFRVGITVAELVHLQIAISANKPVASAASVGYIYGMFNCAAKIAKLDLKDPRANIVFENLLSATLFATPEACVQMTKSPDFSSAVSLGESDYDDWIGSQGKATPASLLRLTRF